MGLSENSVSLNPMVNDHYPYEKWLFHWEYTLFSDKPTSWIIGRIPGSPSSARPSSSWAVATPAAMATYRWSPARRRPCFARLQRRAMRRRWRSWRNWKKVEKDDMELMGEKVIFHRRFIIYIYICVHYRYEMIWGIQWNSWDIYWDLMAYDENKWWSNGMGILSGNNGIQRDVWYTNYSNLRSNYG